MRALLIEMTCPMHGLERFSIKIVKRFNIHKNEIKPRFRNHPTHELSCLLIGREVTEEEVTSYIREYFNKTGYSEFILRIKPVF
ncbi:MAG: hypothetical protein ACTSYR_01455 [Candidatus Odinarchaeia archaeon]